MGCPGQRFIAIWLGLQFLSGAMAPDEKASVAFYAHFGGFLAGGVTMAFLKGEIHSRLIVQDGYIGLRDAAEQAAGLEDAESWLAPPPNVCPHCKRSLDNAAQLAANLLRCGNPACAAASIWKKSGCRDLRARLGGNRRIRRTLPVGQRGPGERGVRLLARIS